MRANIYKYFEKPPTSTKSKKIGDLTVNDGKGLFNNEGLCDSLIGDLNKLPKLLIDGQFVQFCVIITGMVQKLINLKKGIENDLDSMRRKVEELKLENNALVEQLTGLPVDKESDDNGNH